MTTRVVVLVGSPRADSIHRKLADVAAAVAPENAQVAIVDYLGSLPLYNEDLDEQPSPGGIHRLRRDISRANALLVMSPANNGTLTAALKNAIDWASRPYGRSVLSGRPAAVVSAAHDATTVVEHTHLALSIAGARPLPQASATFALHDLKGRHTLNTLNAHEAIKAALRTTVDDLVKAGSSERVA